MLQLNDITLKLDENLILDRISLNIQPGSIWGIIGPPASGKSVLVKTICGFFKPQKGNILFNGTDICKIPETKLLEIRKQIGMLFQNNALFDFMNVWENVAFPLRRSNPDIDPELLREKAWKRLKKVGLAGSEDKLCSELSGGMQKRVGIARATINKAPLNIYDEPTAGLDPVTTSKIYDLLLEIKRQNSSTVLAISSDVEGLRNFVDNIIVLHEGKIRYSGPEKGLETSTDPVVHQFVRGEEEGPL
ncbi:MAG: ATP-binding cassette domain-containing protein [Deltaproteobacteria bacterium]|jgi:phospholipid/cholesterol/gamma-HCH transport system ATP-binding protein|nr:ATP-binding cassette domain-containing protein [Deltaproteobacteria bacterium]